MITLSPLSTTTAAANMPSTSTANTTEFLDPSSPISPMTPASPTAAASSCAQVARTNSSQSLRLHHHHHEEDHEEDQLEQEEDLDTTTAPSANLSQPEVSAPTPSSSSSSSTSPSNASEQEKKSQTPSGHNRSHSSSRKHKAPRRELLPLLCRMRSEDRRMKIRSVIERHFHHHPQFVLRKFIRESLMGFVYEAKHIPTNAIVVIKAYWWECIARQCSLDLVVLRENPQQEWNLHCQLSALDSPYLLKCFGVVDEYEVLYSVLEKGGSEFFDFVVHHDKKDQILKFLKQFVSGVATLHRANVAHRDLSLENALLSPDEKALKIIDFGLAVHHQKDTLMPGDVVGKLSYMSPEVFSGKAFDPFKADVWSCAIVILTALLRASIYDSPVVSKELGPQQVDNFLLISEGRIAELAKAHNVELDGVTIDLLQRMLAPPQRRCSIEDVIAHPWFTSN